MKPKKTLESFSRLTEETVQAYWKKNAIPNKARTQNGKSKKKFYFMDGPPYATGYIHMGTALNKISKDVVIRAKRMQGFDVYDRPGYDTHGVPIENKIEQKHGFKTKQDIIDYGIKAFVHECKDYATQFISVQNAEFADLGVWMDWDNPYLTLSDEYTQTNWWTFKRAFEKGLLYKGKYSIHTCPHCETAVSYNEIEYDKQTDTSVYVKYPSKKDPNLFFIIWTTTPWTLPANTGIMVHPDFEYDFLKLSNGETWVIAHDLSQKIMDAVEAGYVLQKTVKGKTLEGMEYENPLEPLMKRPALPGKNRVILSKEYVHLDAGTGLVHTAPGHGKEDYDAGIKNGLPVYCPVGLDGILNAETGKYAGKKARVVDAEIIEDLKASGHLIFQHPYTHDYPLCWRCKTPLLMVSVPQWYFRISGIQKRLLELNEKVHWVPSAMKARMKNWLEGIGDWPISRQRYWGTALPIWTCECDHIEVVGSIAELEKKSEQKVVNVHKPEIDQITIPCPNCKKTMHRVPEVLDVWFDAGVSSWATFGYPQKKTEFERYWPADYNIEGPDQFRGWWNAQLITSTICFDQAPFKSIAVHGLVLDLGKKKMSKSAGNATKPSEVIEKFSRDYLRYYMVLNSRGDDVKFDWDAFEDIRRFFNIFWNTYNFCQLYLDLDPTSDAVQEKKLAVEDQWILSRLHSLIRDSVDAYNAYTPYVTLQQTEQFVINDLSRTYIKLVRDRAKNNSKDMAAAQTLNHIIINLLRVLAPILPHISEHFYLHYRTEKLPESIHFHALPIANKKWIEPELEKEFENAQKLVQQAMAMREKLKLRLRWPLKELVIVSKDGKRFSKTREIIQKSLNVRTVSEVREQNNIAEQYPASNFEHETAKELENIHFFLDKSSDATLREEWEFEELRRLVQDARKKAGCNPNETVTLELGSSDPAFIAKHKTALEAETKTKIVAGTGEMQKILERMFYVKIKN